MTLSRDQEKAADAIEEWFVRRAEPEFRLGGLAGTGKSTLAAHLPDWLGLREGAVAFCAPTGKAARVLKTKLDGPDATTIHRLIYQPVEEHCAKCPADEETPCHFKRGNSACCTITYQRVPFLSPEVRIVIVDEASMVNDVVYADLMSLGTRVVWIGDHGQLPPVKSEFSLMEKLDVRLEKIHRQAAYLSAARLRVR